MPFDADAVRRWLDDILYDINLADHFALGLDYRHEYEDVAATEVWDTLKHHLLPLRVAVEQELAALRHS